MKTPLVSVIFPVYNTSKYLRQTVESLLNQTYSNLEIIAIDDCSTDDSLEILQSYPDPRLKIHRNEKNLGLIRTLNKAMGLASGDFHARMDSDDICHPERFEKQVRYMLAHPECVLLGTDRATIDENDQSIFYYTRPATGSPMMKWKLLTGNFITHPSVMMRASRLPESLYEEKYRHTEDYAAWLRLSEIGDVDVLPERLISYRVHAASMIQTNKAKHVQAASEALLDHLRKCFDQSFSLDAISLWISPQESVHLSCPADYIQLLTWMNPLHHRFRKISKLSNTLKCLVHYYRRLLLLSYIYRKRPSLFFKVQFAILISPLLIN